MLYWKYSSTRTFFLNEYWIFIPTILLVDYLLIRKIRLDRKRLIEQIEHEKKVRKILLLSLGLSGCAHLLTRGGSSDLVDIIDINYIRELYNIEKGVRYLDNKRLRKIITDLYRHKRKGRIIYITATAVCHIAKRYGLMVFPLTIGIGDFGLTNVYQTLRKAFVSLLLGGVLPLIFIGGPVPLMVALGLGMTGLRLAFNNLDIATSPVDLTKEVKSRIPGVSDIVVLNNRNNIIMNEPEKPECWLPDQRLLNGNCKVKPTEIPDVVDSILPDLNYEDTVNMQDSTALDRVVFTDQSDLGQPKLEICKPRKAKQVNLLDIVEEAGPIGENEGWDTLENEFRVSEEKNIYVQEPILNFLFLLHISY